MPSTTARTPLSRLLQPFRAAAAAFFRHDVALRRDGKNMHVMLRERSEPGAPPPPTLTERATRKGKEEIVQLRAELAALLNELPETRHTMRHLVFVEQALAKKGLRALHKLPVDVLQRALDQLEGLVVNWSREGLANLRSKMAVAIIDREHADPQAENDAYRTAAVLDATTPPPREPAVERSDDEALAAAYAALGTMAPDTGVDALSSVPAPFNSIPVPFDSQPAPLDEPALQMQGDLSSKSARALRRADARASESMPEPMAEIRIRELV